MGNPLLKCLKSFVKISSTSWQKIKSKKKFHIFLHNCTVGPLCNIRCCEHISGKVLKTSNMLLGTFRGIKGTRIWYLLTSQAQGIDIIKAELLGGQEKRACFWPKTAFWKSPISQKVFNIFWWFFFCLVMGTLYYQKNYNN